MRWQHHDNHGDGSGKQLHEVLVPERQDLNHRTSPIAHGATAIAIAATLAACSPGGGSEPSGVTFSAAVDDIAAIDSPLPEVQLLPEGSRPVAVLHSADDIVVLSLGPNACGVAVKGEAAGTQAMSIDLEAEPRSQIRHSDEIGDYAEAGISPSADEWILRCGSRGVQMCGIPMSDSTVTVGFVKSDDSDCLLVGAGHP